MGCAVKILSALLNLESPTLPLPALARSGSRMFGPVHRVELASHAAWKHMCCPHQHRKPFAAVPLPDMHPQFLRAIHYFRSTLLPRHEPPNPCLALSRRFWHRPGKPSGGDGEMPRSCADVTRSARADQARRVG